MEARNPDPTTSYHFGVFQLIPHEHQLLCNGNQIALPPKTFETLVVLVEKSGRLIEKEELMQTLWPDTFVEEANLTHHISALRKALGEKENGQQYIQTVPRRGYRFVADVRKSVTEPHTLVELTPRKRSIRNVVLVSLIIAAVILLGYVTYTRIWTRKSTQTGKIVLLVLPFENPSGNPEEQFFSDGMTEEMITELANLQPDRLRVIARTSAVRAKSSGKSIDQFAHELGADYVLESSVYRVNDRVRINARLFKVTDQSPLWAQAYDRELHDILGLQNEIARSISQEIALQLNAANQPATVRQIDPEAHEAYLKGLYYFDKLTEPAMKTSIEYFQRAIEKEPGYAAPYARMARAYGLLGNFNSLRPEEAYPKEKEAALKALEIDGRLAEARAALGWAKLFYDRDWDGAREEFQKAVDLNPNLASAHQAYATYFVCMGQFDRGEAEILKAQELDPINLNIKADVGWNLFFARRTDEAIAQLKQVVQMDPGFSIAHNFLAHAYQQKGMFDEAIREAQKAAELLNGSEHRLGNLGDAYARAGKKQEALSILARLKKASRDHYISPYQTGLIYASLGQPDEALDWLERAYNDRFWMMAFLKVDPRWDSLRSHPRFIDILRRTGLPAAGSSPTVKEGCS